MGPNDIYAVGIYERDRLVFTYGMPGYQDDLEMYSMVCDMHVEKKEYGGDGYRVILMKMHGLAFVVIASTKVPSRMVSQLVYRIATPYKEDDEKTFRAFLQESIEWITDPYNDKVGMVEFQMEEVKTTMLDNIDGMLHRGEKLEDLKYEAEDLEDEGALFNHETPKLKRKIRNKNLKLKLAILLVFCCAAVTFFFIAVFAICVFILMWDCFGGTCTEVIKNVK